MKKIAIFCMLVAGLFNSADAATQRRGRSSGTAAPASGTTGGAKPVAARAATGARTAPKAATAATSTGAANTVVRGRSGTTPTATAAKPVAARAGTTQKVIGTGTKVATAAKNVVVSEECQAKYEGCMDAFCMLDNETGGRCICSDKNAEFDAILAEIEKLDQQSYKMATVGVERLEMGDDASAVLKSAQSVADSIIAEGNKVEKATENTQKARRTLDLSLWDTSVNFDEEEDVFGESNPIAESIEGKEGDALHTSAAKICASQMPECAKELNMLKAMYSQRVRSDCAAYENTLKQQKNASAQKLAAAEQALRQTALDQYRSANKYDLGQCTVEFKKCMQTTGGCGEDFAGCASVSAMDATNVTKSTTRGSKAYQIKGAATTIEISASTYDMLVSKKPLCESVTKSCVNVASQVWDTFLKEVAPQMKAAELIAENNNRQNCIGTISDCFQKACKESMDPNDPDATYDMCLTRPGTMLNVCKIPLNSCGIDASSEAAADQSPIWGYVLARLASMRVDSCTKEVKECIQSEDRCGPDYSNCIGLDTDTVIRMCPYDKMVGCQKEYGADKVGGEETYDKIANLIQGLLLNIDNSMYTACQNAIDAAVTKVCGGTEDCMGLNIDKELGARTLSYKMCAKADANNERVCFENAEMVPSDMLGAGEAKGRIFDGIISGEMPWGDIDLVAETSTVDEDGGALIAATPSKGMKYLSFKGNASEAVVSEIEKIDALIASTIASIEADEKVKQCISGRTVQGMKVNNSREDLTGSGRFPQLASTARTMVGNAVLSTVRNNYYAKFDELRLKEAKDIANLASKMSEYDAIEAAHAEELHALEMDRQRMEMETKAEIAKINAETERQIKLAQSQAEIEKIRAESQIKIAEAQQTLEVKKAETEVLIAEKQAEIEVAKAETEKTKNEAKQAAAAVNRDACLASVGDKPVITGLTSTQDYSVNQKGTVREEFKTATYDQSTGICTLETKSRDCKDIKCNTTWLLCKPRRCENGKWGDWKTNKQELQF